MSQERVNDAGPRPDQAQAPLLASRLTAPPPPVPMVARPRLDRLLDDAMSRSVTLVCAPAGWGKTTLLGSWAASRPTGTAPAWLSVEAGDSGGRFWAYLTAALHDDGCAPVNGLDSCHGAELLDRLAAGLADRPEPALLVLDDLNRLDDLRLLDGLDFLLRHAGGRLRLMIGARVEPALGLSRWRLRGELTEIRAAELEFTVTETAQLLAAHGVDLADDQVRRLWARTEGWPAALRLIALSLRGQPDPARLAASLTGVHPTVADYLAEEVLGAVPDEIREVLCRAALPERTPGALVNLLTGRTDGEQVLTRAAREVGFISIRPGLMPGFRYHRLLGELLRAELTRRHPAEIQVLHERTATWCAAHDLPAEALRHALAGGLGSLATRILVRHWPELVPYGCGAVAGPAPVEGPAAGGLPGEGIAPAVGPEPLPEQQAAGQDTADPLLALARATDRLVAADLAGADDQLRLASAWAGLADPGATLPAEPGELAGPGAVSSLAEPGEVLPAGPVDRDKIALIMAALRLARAELAGDPEAVRRAVGQFAAGAPTADRQAVAAIRHAALGGLTLDTGDLADARRELTAGLECARLAGIKRAGLVCAGRLAIIEAVRGRLRASEEIAQVVTGPLPGYAHPGSGPAEPSGTERPEGTHAQLALALIALHRDRGDVAEAGLAQVGPVRRFAGSPVPAALHALIRAQLLADRGELASAVRLLQSARGQLTGLPRADWLGYRLLAVEAELLAVSGDPGAARESLRTTGCQGDPLGRVRPAEAPLAVALTRVECLAGDLRAAQEALPDWVHPDARHWSLDTRLAAGLLDAYLAERAEDRSRVHRSLEQVLRWAEPEIHRRVLSHAQPPVRDLLVAHLDSGTACWPLVSELLSVDRATGSGMPDLTPLSTRVGIAEPLTERELTVLRYLQSILSNVEIASELSLSVNTVKTHVRNIYRKLDATRRREAVRRARELRLL